MIKSEDFAVSVENAEGETTVRVVHKPTGNVRYAESVAAGSIGTVRDRLLAELRSLLFRSEDIRMDVGRSEGGDFIRVVHLPSGIERSAMRCESSHDELLDLVLEELHATS